MRSNHRCTEVNENKIKYNLIMIIHNLIFIIYICEFAYATSWHLKPSKLRRWTQKKRRIIYNDKDTHGNGFPGLYLLALRVLKVGRAQMK
jgi:hypothetical protein